jgi:hypothetical protein
MHRLHDAASVPPSHPHYAAPRVRTEAVLTLVHWSTHKSVIPLCGRGHGQGGWYGRSGDTYCRHAAGVRLFAVVAQIRRIA